MVRPVTLVSGQYGDIPLEQLCALVADIGDPPDPDRRRQRLPMDPGATRSRPDRGAALRDHRLTQPRPVVHCTRTRRDPGTSHGSGPCRPARDAAIEPRCAETPAVVKHRTAHPACAREEQRDDPIAWRQEASKLLLLGRS